MKHVVFVHGAGDGAYEADSLLAASLRDALGPDHEVSSPRMPTEDTAGFRDFDVEYRIDGGAWRLVRDNTTATGTSWTSRQPGHTYWVRVRGRDRAGNSSAWSKPMGVTVP